jgi:Cu/Ag efflux pump CusA
VQPAALVEQISRLSNGRLVSTVVDGYRRFDVVIRLPETLRNPGLLLDLQVGEAGNRPHPLLQRGRDAP